MKVKTVNLVANALIELDMNNMTPLIDTDTLCRYADAISKKSGLETSVNGLDILDIKSNHSKYIKMIQKNGLFGIQNGKTSQDLIIKYRDIISYKLMDAVKSEEAYTALGITEERLNKKSNPILTRLPQQLKK